MLTTQAHIVPACVLEDVIDDIVVGHFFLTLDVACAVALHDIKKHVRGERHLLRIEKDERELHSEKSYSAHTRREDTRCLYLAKSPFSLSPFSLIRTSRSISCCTNLSAASW